VNRLTCGLVKLSETAGIRQEESMWQVHAQFRLGDIQTGEIDITPALCLCFVVGTFALMITTGL
jgi:hypothetical protein